MNKLLSRAASVARSIDPRDRLILLGILLTGGAIGAVSPVLGVLFVGVALLYLGLQAP